MALGHARTGAKRSVNPGIQLVQADSWYRHSFLECSGLAGLRRETAIHWLPSNPLVFDTCRSLVLSWLPLRLRSLRLVPSLRFPFQCCEQRWYQAVSGHLAAGYRLLLVPSPSGIHTYWYRDWLLLGVLPLRWRLCWLPLRSRLCWLPLRWRLMIRARASAGLMIRAGPCSAS